MGLEDRLIKDQQKAVKNRNAPDPYYESEPTGMEYKDREKQPFLNDYKGVFAEKDEKAINKMPSVFDATTIFDTRKGQAG